MSKEMDAIGQAIRESHCARDDKEHGCVGEATFGPDGLVLTCRLCGTGDDRKVPPKGRYADLVTDVLRAAGLSWKALSVDAQEACVAAIDKQGCPNCGTLRLSNHNYYTCGCGWTYSGGFQPGWGSPRKETT